MSGRLVLLRKGRAFRVRKTQQKCEAARFISSRAGEDVGSTTGRWFFVENSQGIRRFFTEPLRIGGERLELEKHDGFSKSSMNPSFFVFATFPKKQGADLAFRNPFQRHRSPTKHFENT